MFICDSSTIEPVSLSIPESRIIAVANPMVCFWSWAVSLHKYNSSIWWPPWAITSSFFHQRIDELFVLQQKVVISPGRSITLSFIVVLICAKSCAVTLPVCSQRKSKLIEKGPDHKNPLHAGNRNNYIIYKKIIIPVQKSHTTVLKIISCRNRFI